MENLFETNLVFMRNAEVNFWVGNCDFFVFLILLDMGRKTACKSCHKLKIQYEMHVLMRQETSNYSILAYFELINK